MSPRKAPFQKEHSFPTSNIFQGRAVDFRGVPSLKLTFSPLKMDGWNTTFLLGRLIFRGYVSFREGKFDDSYSTTSGTFSPSFLAPLPAASSEVSFNLDCGTARRWTKSNGPQMEESELHKSIEIKLNF